MQALITGANGFVGSTLARRLCARGDQVRCLEHESGDNRLLAGLEVQHFQGDVTDPASLRCAIQGAEVVFHLAGLRRSPERQRFMEVNAEGTRHLCQVMVEAAPAARLVLMSSIAAVGPRRDSPAEDAPLAPADWYGESKAEAERIARSFFRQLSVTIARPTRILGPGDRENLLLFKIVGRGLRLSIGGGPRTFSVIDVEDVVDALLLLAERPEAVGEAFFVSREETGMETLEDEIARALGKRTRNLHVPELAFRALAEVADRVSQATGHHLPLNRKLAQQVLVPAWTCSTKKAEERLGFRAKVPVPESVARSARWYRENGWI
jgi:nucleoside-diphosphate-sugar epimerase